MGKRNDGDYPAAVAAYLRTARGGDTSARTARALLALDGHTDWTPRRGLQGVHVLRGGLDKAYALASSCLRPLAATRLVATESRLLAWHW